MSRPKRQYGLDVQELMRRRLEKGRAAHTLHFTGVESTDDGYLDEWARAGPSPGPLVSHIQSFPLFAKL